MKRYCLGDHPEITIIPDPNAKFFSTGGKFDLPDLEEKIKEVDRRNDKIIIIGESHTRLLITASSRMLDKIQEILENNIGIFLSQIENLEVSG